MKPLTVSMVLIFLTIKTFGQLNYYVGNYTGNGNSTQAITGIGFKPDVIIIKGEDAVPPIICTSSMASGYSKDMSIVTNTATVSTFINSIDANGFTVKLNAASNTNHTVYYFICIKSQGGCKVFSTRSNILGTRFCCSRKRWRVYVYERKICSRHDI